MSDESTLRVIDIVFEQLVRFSNELEDLKDHFFSPGTSVRPEGASNSTTISPACCVDAVVLLDPTIRSAAVSTTSSLVDSSVQRSKLDDLRSVISAEFLVEEAVAQQGITKAYALKLFEEKSQERRISKSQWQTLWTEIRSTRNLPPNAEELVQSYCRVLLVANEALWKCPHEEEEGRNEMEKEWHSQIHAQHDTFQRKRYAMVLREKLDRDYAVASAGDPKPADEATIVGAAEVRRLRWESETMAKKLETKRKQAVEMDEALIRTKWNIEQIAQQTNTLKQWAAVSQKLALQEAQDAMEGVLHSVESRRSSHDAVMDRLESLVTSLGRQMMVSDVTSRGANAHQATLRQLDQQHKVEFSWLIPDVSASAALDRTVVAPETEDESLAYDLLRDRATYTAATTVSKRGGGGASSSRLLDESLIRSGTNDDDERDGVGWKAPPFELSEYGVQLLTKVWDSLLLLQGGPSSIADSTTVGGGITHYHHSPSRQPSSNNNNNKNSRNVALDHFVDWFDGCPALKTPLDTRLFLRRFFPSGVVTWDALRHCLLDAAYRLFPRHARFLSPSALMDVVLREVVAPYHAVRHQSAATIRHASPRRDGGVPSSSSSPPHMSLFTNAATHNNGGAPYTISSSAGPTTWAALLERSLQPLSSFADLIDEGIGCLVLAKSSYSSFVEAYRNAVVLYPGAEPAAVHSTGLGLCSKYIQAYRDEFFGAEQRLVPHGRLHPVLESAGKSAPPAAITAKASHNDRTLLRDEDGSVDAVCGWLALHLEDVWPRHELVWEMIALMTHVGMQCFGVTSGNANVITALRKLEPFTVTQYMWGLPDAHVAPSAPCRAEDLTVFEQSPCPPSVALVSLVLLSRNTRFPLDLPALLEQLLAGSA